MTARSRKAKPQLVSAQAPVGLPLPHERDETTEMPLDPPRRRMRQALKDLASGQEDTDLRATRGVRITAVAARKRVKRS